MRQHMHPEETIFTAVPPSREQEQVVSSQSSNKKNDDFVEVQVKVQQVEEAKVSVETKQKVSNSNNMFGFLSNP